MIPRLYCQVPLSEGLVMELPAAAAHYATRVLRLREGDAITLFNGEGGEFDAHLSRIAPKAVYAAVGAHRAIERESPLDVTLMQGLASAERMDWVIQKAVELGAAAIAPVTMARSVARLDATRAIKRALHWRSVIVASCEQCGRNRLPVLHPLADLADALARPHAPAGAIAGREAVSLVLSPADGSTLSTVARPSGPIRVLVGPEGGLDPGELSASKRAGFQAVVFGPRVLRTETAGIAVLAAMSALWGDAR